MRTGGPLPETTPGGTKSAGEEQRLESLESERAGIFLSYSRSDEQWLQRIRFHLEPLHTIGLIEIWCDKSIVAGERWEEEIQRAVGRSEIAVLVISKNFLDSVFISQVELPLILGAHEQRGLSILPFIVEASGFAEDLRVARFQTVNRLENPVSSLASQEQEKELAHLVATAAGILLKRRSVAGSVPGSG